MPVADLIGAVEAAGYRRRWSAATARRPDDAAAGAACLWRRLVLALVFFVPLSDLSLMLSLLPRLRFPGWQWVLIALAAPVVAVGRLALPPRRAGQRPARRRLHGHAGVAGHHRGHRLVGVRHVRARPGGGRGPRHAAAQLRARRRRRDLPRGRRDGDHVPAGRAVLRGQGPADRGRGHARPGRGRRQGRLPARPGRQRGAGAGRPAAARRHDRRAAGGEDRGRRQVLFGSRRWTRR